MVCRSGWDLIGTIVPPEVALRWLAGQVGGPHPRSVTVRSRSAQAGGDIAVLSSVESQPVSSLASAGQPDVRSGARLSENPYAIRFDERDHAAKDAAWRSLVSYLSRWIDPGQPVVDIGCDRGYFIRHVVASERWAVDLRDVGDEQGGARFLQASGLNPKLPDGHFGTVFLSNILEHLRSPDEVIEQLAVAARLLSPTGRVIVLQPNIRYVGPAYWDFIDHRVALTHYSLIEAGEMAGLQTEHLIPRFLPYTTKSRWPVNAALTAAYLRIPIAWRLLGKQTLWIARKRP
jgi:2-polyprenyl-3-methyl-5-hydroxy-6-metoxy-1,4-benzoquinol methylase